MEFVLYLGKQPQKTVSDPKLSKVYHFTKAVPVQVANETDKTILLMFVENSGCATCGNKSNSRPIMSDVTYCTYRRMDLGQFRKKWEDHYNLQIS